MIKPIRPMLATLVPKPFHRPGWVYEEKYDGVRALAYRRRRRARLYSRPSTDATGPSLQPGTSSRHPPPSAR
jgi:ATP-dependent DNA ligase